MYIIGVKSHVPCRLVVVDNKLQETFPKGIESMVIELPENWNEVSDYTTSNFFEPLAKIYSERGTQVIYGDFPLKIPINIKKTIDSLRNQELSKREIFSKQLSLMLYSFSDLTSQGVIDNFLNHERDEHFKKIINYSQPNVVLVGDLHARYLAKRFPEAKYIGIL